MDTSRLSKGVVIRDTSVFPGLGMVLSLAYLLLQVINAICGC
jgi:hypothetical protein